MPSPPPPRAASQRSTRSDGSNTRAQILETAGEVYAELGWARATSKEICARSRTNMAAVNYHFGGKDGLYQAVLVEAHRRLVSLEDLQAIAGTPAAPARQLAALLRRLLQPSVLPGRPWALRVLIQELMAPSPHVGVLIREAVLPKVRVLSSLVARVLELPPRHPGVQRAVLFTIVPAVVLVVAPRPMRETVLPAIDADPGRAVDELVTYALAGLAALRSRHRAERRRGAPEPPAKSPRGRSPERPARRAAPAGRPANQSPATRRAKAASKSRT
jgi:AcrR family transcriptional regulator